MYRTAFPQTPSSYMLLCIFIPISTDLKGEKNALLSAHSFCLINWRLSQVFLHTITVSFPEKKTWWMLRSWIVASLKKKKSGFCLYQRAGSTFLIRLCVHWKSADILPKSIRQYNSLITAYQGIRRKTPEED